MSRWSLGWGHRQASWILTGMNKRLFQSYPTWKCPVQGHHRRNTFFYPFSVFDSGSLTIKPWASHRHSYLASAKETCEHLYLGISTFFLTRSAFFGLHFLLEKTNWWFCALENRWTLLLSWRSPAGPFVLYRQAICYGRETLCLSHPPLQINLDSVPVCY